MKNFLLPLFVLYAFLLHAQIVVNAPVFAGKQFRVIAFKGFETDTLFSSNLNTEGGCVSEINHEGFVLLQFDEKMIYPFLYSAVEKNFTVSHDGFPDFSNSPQNDFFFRLLLKRQELNRKIMTLDESANDFRNDTVLFAAMNDKKNILVRELDEMSRSCLDSVRYIGGILIAANGLIERSYKIKTEVDLSVSKKEFRDFIKKHYGIVANSDMLQQFANQYMMMNEYVIVGKKKIEDQTVQDIRDWIVLLKDHYTDQEVVHYFLKYYRGRLMITMSGAIMDAFPKQAPCNIPKDFTAGGIIPATNKKTLYIVIDPDCPASVTGQVMINRFIKENKINVPVITVFTGRAPGQGDYRVLPDIENSQVMLKGIAQIDNKEVKIEKYPAFILVNDEGKVTAKEYSLASIKEKLLPE